MPLAPKFSAATSDDALFAANAYLRTLCALELTMLATTIVVTPTVSFTMKSPRLLSLLSRTLNLLPTTRP